MSFGVTIEMGKITMCMFCKCSANDLLVSAVRVKNTVTIATRFDFPVFG